MKIELVDDAAQAPRWWSIWLMVGAIVMEIGPELIPIWAEVIPAGASRWATAILATLAIVARVLKQEFPHVGPH